jgi:hypothetical protein
MLSIQGFQRHNVSNSQMPRELQHKKMLVYWTQSTNSRFLSGWQRLFLLGRCYYCIMTITYSSDPINQTIKEEIQLDWYHPLNSVKEELTTELPKEKQHMTCFSAPGSAPHRQEAELSKHAVYPQIHWLYHQIPPKWRITISVALQMLFSSPWSGHDPPGMLGFRLSICLSI